MKTESIGKSKTNKRYVNIKEASEYTSIPVKTLYEWSSVGRVPSIKLGRKLLFDLFDIQELMSSMKRVNNQEDKTVNKIVGGVNGYGI
jgi:excisionase family DNA binding protein